MRRHSLLAPLAALVLAGCPNAGPPQGAMTVVQVPASGAPSAGPSAAAAASARPSAGPSAAPSAAPTAAPTRGPRPADSAPPGGTIDAQSRFAGKTVTPKGRVAIETTKGTFVLTLFPDQAPKAVEKFLSLVRGGTYDGTTFHRVVPNFVAQGGDPLSKTLPAGDPRIGTGGEGEGVPDDFDNGLAHLPGAVALARSDAPSSSRTQFYVCLTRLGSLDKRYIVFGQVVAGFDNVQKLTVTGPGVTPDQILRAVVDED